jgi:hypothetical protein
MRILCVCPSQFSKSMRGTGGTLLRFSADSSLVKRKAHAGKRVNGVG